MFQIELANVAIYARIQKAGGGGSTANRLSLEVEILIDLFPDPEDESDETLEKRCECCQHR